MRAETTAAVSIERPSTKIFLVLMLLIDAAILLQLRQAPVVLAGLLAVGLLTLFALRPPYALAFAVAGLPLLDLAGGGETVGALRPFQLVLVAPLVVASWIFLWQSGVPGRAGPRGEAPARLLGSPLLWSSLALGGVLWLGLQTSPSPGYGSSKLTAFVVVNLLLLVSGALLLAERRSEPEGESDRAHATHPRTWALLRGLVVFLALVASVAIANYFLEFDFWEKRLRVLDLNTIWLGRFMGAGILALIALRAAGRIPGSIFAAAGSIFAVVFYLSGSRGPLVALFLALLFWSLTSPRVRRWSARRLWAWGVGTVVVVGGLLVWMQAEPGFFSPFTGREASNMARLMMLEVAREALGEAGLLGVGTGGFSALMGFGDLRFYPHNVLIEIWIENGLPGMVAFLGFLVAFAIIWIRGWKRSSTGNESSIVLRLVGAQFLFALANAQFSGDLTANEWLWFWAGALAAWRPE